MAISLLAFHMQAPAQGVLKKFKEKVNETVEKAVGNTIQDKTGLPTGQQPSNTGNSQSNSGKPTNRGGTGLTNTEPPDVKAQMAEAKTAHAAAKYSDARYSLQQALQGVEIQLGREILKSLPAEVQSMKADTLQDKVMSTQWGWNNLSIQRVYSAKPEKQMTIIIGNAGIYSGLAQLYFANYGMIEANASQQNMKQVRVKGNKGVIEWDENKGYTLIISLGQTSGILWECINFANEQEVMVAANSFDIDGIKKMLGEQ